MISPIGLPSETGTKTLGYRGISASSAEARPDDKGDSSPEEQTPQGLAKDGDGPPQEEDSPQRPVGHEAEQKTPWDTFSFPANFSYVRE